MDELSSSTSDLVAQSRALVARSDALIAQCQLRRFEREADTRRAQGLAPDLRPAIDGSEWGISGV